ncbi:hypothetical protein [Puia dinghuensis]|uniref:Uncharacterized protein n=1 Tax=Puia dinghuensis TaxID=1792502 RepID=A0A8J2UIQ8_9BACT|nr:hypothetical protein [Puia dinghuensis]GGB23559.1 hypothetical protein GCM10011511_54280 [Puia dinghuensis]
MLKTTLTEPVKIEVIIVEDDVANANLYKRKLEIYDRVEQYISRIQTYKDAPAFIAADSEMRPNRVYIADLSLGNDTKRGIEWGLKAMNHLVTGRDNPIVVCSAFRTHPEFQEIFARYPEIIVEDKDPKRVEEVCTKVYKKVIARYEALNETSGLQLSVGNLLDEEGNPLPGQKAIYKRFNELYPAEERDQRDALFLAKCFLTVPARPAFTVTDPWRTKRATWVVNLTEIPEKPETPDHPEQGHKPLLKLVYTKKTRELVSVELEIKNEWYEISMDSMADFGDILPYLQRNDAYDLQKWIIRYFVICRCVDLFTDRQLQPDDLQDLFIVPELFGERAVLWQWAFITLLWEKLMFRCRGNKKLVYGRLKDLYEVGFPEVKDIFYGKISTPGDEERNYFGAEMKSVDVPNEVFLMEYDKSNFPELEPWPRSKPFKLSYLRLQDPPGILCWVQNVLQEEFKYLSAKTYT